MKVMISSLQTFKQFLAENREWLIAWPALIIAILLTIHFWPAAPSPVPAAIKKQIEFSIIYPDPRQYSNKPNQWSYDNKDSAVQFTVSKDKYNVVFTEEEVPLAYQNDVAAYNRFVGSLKPSANFNVPLGTASITNFVTAGDYEVVGKTGILNTHGTLLLAHPDTELTDDQWRSLFESLQVDGH